LLGACLCRAEPLSIDEALRHIRTVDDQLPRKAHKRFPLQLNLQPNNPCRSPVAAAAPEQRRCARTRLLDAPSRPFSAQSVGRAHMQVCFTPAFALVLGLVRPIRHIAERYRTAHALQHNRSCSSTHRRRSRLHDSPRTEATKLKVGAAQSNHVQCFAQAKEGAPENTAPPTCTRRPSLKQVWMLNVAKVLVCTKQKRTALTETSLTFLGTQHGRQTEAEAQ
jgi:hypothetical protein